MACCPYTKVVRNPRLVSEPFVESFQGSGVYINPETGEQLPGTIEVPCYHCLICQDNRRNEWATRCELEARVSGSSYFATLTYEDKNLPADGCVSLGDFQSFIKELRRKVPGSIRYFACAEYGPRFSQRPHYHCNLFFENDFDEEVVEAFVSSAWCMGFVKVTRCTRNHYRYVAKYTLKWLNSAPAEGMTEPFAVMSRRPGIGAGYFEKYKGFCMSNIPLENGYTSSIPRYGLDRLSLVDKVAIKRSRLAYMESLKEVDTVELRNRGKALEQLIYRKCVSLYGKQQRKSFGGD